MSYLDFVDSQKYVPTGSKPRLFGTAAPVPPPPAPAPAAVPPAPAAIAPPAAIPGFALGTAEDLGNVTVQPYWVDDAGAPGGGYYKDPISGQYAGAGTYFNGWQAMPPKNPPDTTEQYRTGDLNWNPQGGAFGTDSTPSAHWDGRNQWVNDPNFPSGGYWKDPSGNWSNAEIQGGAWMRPMEAQGAPFAPSEQPSQEVKQAQPDAQASAFRAWDQQAPKWNPSESQFRQWDQQGQIQQPQKSGGGFLSGARALAEAAWKTSPMGIAAAVSTGNWKDPIKGAMELAGAAQKYVGRTYSGAALGNLVKIRGR